MKTKLARSIALFKNKYQFIFEQTNQGFIARSGGKSGPPIILENGFPSFDDQESDCTQKGVFYINKSPRLEEIKATLKPEIEANDLLRKNVKPSRRGIVSAKENCCFKGFRQILGIFKANCYRTIA